MAATPPRKPIRPEIETAILTKSARRCALCVGLDGDTSEKYGQIAHLDQKRSNNSEDNLVYLCFDHHDRYDSRSRQSKGLQIGEVKAYRERLYQAVERGSLHAHSRVTPGTKFELRRALLEGCAFGRQIAGALADWNWYLRAEVYVVPPLGIEVVLPYHSCSVVLESATGWKLTFPIQNLSPQWDTTRLEWNGGDVLKHTKTELRAAGPGMIEAHASLLIPNPPVMAPDNLALIVHLQDAHQTTDAQLNCRLSRLPGCPVDKLRWSWKWSP